VEILVSVGIGVAVGWLATIWRRSAAGGASGIAIGVLGALLGVAAATWLRSFGQTATLDSAVASTIGSSLLLLLGVVAQRLFLHPAAGANRRN
jgi:uncharacterized membrane protein YeaQ/YmgE (transglycosylase-associated protein family)